MIILTLIFIAIIVALYDNKKERLKKIKENKIEQNSNELYNFKTYNYIMTKTEEKFYKELKNQLLANNIKCNIFPQIGLERIIQTKNNDFADRNRIKSRSIDFTITDETDNKIICCIELDDYTHQRADRIERDNFINELFKTVKIKLVRMTVSNNYNFEELIKILKEATQTTSFASNGLK